MNREKLEEVLLGPVSEYMVNEMALGACHSIAILVSQVLRERGLKAEARTCQILFANEGWVKLAREKGIDFIARALETKTLPDDAWSVGIGYYRPGDHEDPLHAVIHLTETDEIIDLTAHQADRPSKGLRVRPFWKKLGKLGLPVVHFKFIDLRSDPKIYSLDRAKVEVMRRKVHELVDCAFKEEPHGSPISGG